MCHKNKPLLHEGNNLTVNSKEMAELLSRQYASVFSKPKETLPPNGTVPQSQLENFILAEEDFEEVIDELRKNVAAGLDRFQAIFLKSCKQQLSLSLVILWRMCLDEGFIPPRLKNLLSPQSTKVRAAQYLQTIGRSL